ncbi:MAG TPA: adenylate/guanylate cyclase domain-containing protein [Trebonia sp.]|nr:adenylate/guanylate cyclase domain-containing protein [Trebonia sp.]
MHLVRGRESRRHVSILFIDVVGSTALAERLDPEALQQIMDSYFAACVAAIEEHGGLVEKFIGDAVLAAFGATIAHEDDALRAVRAAAGALSALGELGTELAASHNVSLEARCGICSGEAVVIISRGDDFRVLGDVTNTASRLQTAASPGEILIDDNCAALVHGEVAIEEMPPLHLKGKARPVPAWRVIQPIRAGDDGAASGQTPFLGRADELSELEYSFRRVLRRGQACQVTVLGAPGLGKSRLIREFLATLPADVTIVCARCPAYGRGTTYTPLAEMLSSYPGGWAALEAALLADPDLGGRASRSLASIMSQAPVGAGSDRPTLAGVEEIAWAVRHLLDLISKAGPVVMVWEDLHWAAPTLLGLIDDIAAWLVDAPVLLLCVARPELLEAQPSWGGGKPSALTVELGPLTTEQSAALVSELIMAQDVHSHGDDDLPGRVAAQCDGNPLFAELMLGVFAEVAPGAQIPPTIHALLGARLDQLPDQERQLLEMASVAGREFSRAEVADMTGTYSQLTGAETDRLLDRLVRQRLLDRAGPGAFRFSQALLRDTAYGTAPKARREHWHIFLAERFRRAAAAVNAPAPDDSLAFAYHMEAACLLGRDVRPGDSRLPELASAAADALIDEGMRALCRKDLTGGAALLERARQLLPAGDERHIPLALCICDAGVSLRDKGRSLAALAAAQTALPGSRRASTACRIQRAIVMLRLGLATPAMAACEAQAAAAELADDPRDELGWCRLHQLEAYLHLAGERAALADTQLRLALTRAQAMNSGYEEDRLLCAICEVAQWAPVPVQAGLALCGTLISRFADNRALLIPVIVTRARLDALAGDIDGARRGVATARAYIGDLHLDLADAAVLELSGFVESLAGAHGTAEDYYRRALSTLQVAGPTPDTQALEADIARELLSQGRVDAAQEALGRISSGSAGLGLRASIVVSSLAALIAARRGVHEEALGHVGRACELLQDVDDLRFCAEILFTLGTVQRDAGLNEAARSTAHAALERYLAKGAALPAARVREWLNSVDERC